MTERKEPFSRTLTASMTIPRMSRIPHKEKLTISPVRSYKWICALDGYCEPDEQIFGSWDVQYEQWPRLPSFSDPESFDEYE